MSDPTFAGFRPGEDPWTTHWRWTAVTNGTVISDLRDMHRRETKGGVPTGMCLCGLPAPCATAKRLGGYAATLDGPCGCLWGAEGSCPSRPVSAEGLGPGVAVAREPNGTGNEPRQGD